MTTTFDTLIPRLVNELQTALQSVDPGQVDALRQAILQARNTFVTGKGRSGLYMRSFALRLMHLGLGVYVVDDVTTPAIAAGDLLLIGSGSGRTPSLVGYAARAKALQVPIALITAAESSPIGDQAHVIVRINALTSKLVPSDRTGSFQPMGNLFEQSLGLTLDLLTIQLMEDLNLTSDQMFARHANLE